MNKALGRNDPCSCGSGKKYKNCCLLKNEAKPAGHRKITAKWINAPQGPNLYEKMFGEAIASADKVFKPVTDENIVSGEGKEGQTGLSPDHKKP